MHCDCEKATAISRDSSMSLNMPAHVSASRVTRPTPSHTCTPPTPCHQGRCISSLQASLGKLADTPHPRPWAIHPQAMRGLDGIQDMGGLRGWLCKFKTHTTRAHHQQKRARVRETERQSARARADKERWHSGASSMGASIEGKLVRLHTLELICEAGPALLLELADDALFSINRGRLVQELFLVWGLGLVQRLFNGCLCASS